MCRTCTTRDIVRAECLLQTKGCAHAMYLSEGESEGAAALVFDSGGHEEEKRKEKGP